MGLKWHMSKSTAYDLVLCLTLKCRYEFVERLFASLNNQALSLPNTRFFLLVVDASPESRSIELPSFCPAQVVHMPNAGFFEQLCEVLKIDSKFVSWITDDDIPVLSEKVRQCAMLESDKYKNFGSAKGIDLFFDENTGSVNADKMFRSSMTMLFRRWISSNTRIEFIFFLWPTSMCHGVWRMRVFEKMLKFFQSREEFQGVRAHDRASVILAMMNGGILQSSEIDILRSDTPSFVPRSVNDKLLSDLNMEFLALSKVKRYLFRLSLWFSERNLVTNLLNSSYRLRSEFLLRVFWGKRIEGLRRICFYYTRGF